MSRHRLLFSLSISIVFLSHPHRPSLPRALFSIVRPIKSASHPDQGIPLDRPCRDPSGSGSGQGQGLTSVAQGPLLLRLSCMAAECGGC